MRLAALWRVLTMRNDTSIWPVRVSGSRETIWFTLWSTELWAYLLHAKNQH